MLVKCIIIRIFIIEGIQYKDLLNDHGIMRCYKEYQWKHACNILNCMPLGNQRLSIFAGLYLCQMYSYSALNIIILYYYILNMNLKNL